MALRDPGPLHGTTNSGRDYYTVETLPIPVSFFTQELFVPNHDSADANSLDMRPTLWIRENDSVACLCSQQHSWPLHCAYWSHTWLEYV